MTQLAVRDHTGKVHKLYGSGRTTRCGRSVPSTWEETYIFPATVPDQNNDPNLCKDCMRGDK